MKKLFQSILLLIAIVLPSTVFAAMPDITAGETSFVNGSYILKNNVRVVARGRTMTAHEAKVNVLSQKVWAKGDVTLIQDGIQFRCDSIFVQGTEKTVDVLGNVRFDQENLLNIRSEIAKFSWSTKVADFYGKVSLNVVDPNGLSLAAGINRNALNQTYDHVQYNVVEKKIILLEVKSAAAPKVNMPELRVEI